MPLKKKAAGVVFGKGTAVEVLVKVKYNQDVWYPATIVEICDGSSLLVEYVASIEPRKVSVDCSHIRPTPPLIKDRLFDLLEKVDAFKEFGWWCGLIVKVLPDNRYSVFFGSSFGEFDQKDVRPQLSWKDGKWSASPQEKVTPCQENPGGHVVGELDDISSGRICESKIISKGEKMEQKSPISSCPMESNPWKKLSKDPCTPPKGVLVGANLEKSEFPSSSLGENQTDLVDLGHHESHGIASSPERVKHSSKIATNLEEKFKRGGDAVTPSSISSSENAATSDKQNGGVDSTSGYLPSDYPSSGMRTPKKQKKMDGKEIHTLNHRRKRRQAGEECIKGFTKLAKPVERDSGGKNDVVLRSLECCNFSGSKAKKTCSNNVEESLKLEGDQKKQLNDLPVPDQPEAEKNSNLKKRGRTRKVYEHRKKDKVTEQRGTPSTVYVRRKKAKVTEQVRTTANHDTIIKDRTISEVDPQVAPDSMLVTVEGLLPAENTLMPVGDQLNHGNDLGSTIRKSCLRMPIESNEQALITDQEVQIPKEAKHRITSRNKVVKIPDSSDGTVSMTSEPFCITKEVNGTVEQRPGVFNDQPLPISFEKMHSPGNVKSTTPGAPTATMVEQSIELRQTRKELNGQTASEMDNKNAVAMNNEQVHAQNHVCVESDTMVEHSATRKELNEQTPSAKVNKTAAVMSEEVDARSRVLVDGNTSITTTGEPELPFVKSFHFGQ